MDQGHVTRLLDSLERIATANEELIRLAVEERATPDEPMDALACPYCQVENPRVSSTGGAGPLGEYVLVATCQHCKQQFLGVPRGMHLVTREQFEMTVGKGNDE